MSENSIINNRLWKNDIDLVLEALLEVSELAGKTVMITGAAGLICSSVIDIFIRYNECHEEKIKIVAAGRSEDKIRERFAEYYNEDYFAFLDYDANSINPHFGLGYDYIIHGASNAYPKSIVNEPVETMLSNLTGLSSILEYARSEKKDERNSRVLYISSSEVYGNKGDNEPFIEDEYGSIDILNPRSSYPESKRAAETLCISYGVEYGVDVVIVRPGHIYGPTASRQDNRVSSMWAYDAAARRNIVMKSDGMQLRSYTYCLDCASAIIKILINGQKQTAYNISNRESIASIKELAESLSDIGEINLIREIASCEDAKAYNSMKNSSLNSDRLYELGWKGLFSLREGLEHTVNILRSKDID